MNIFFVHGVLSFHYYTMYALFFIFIYSAMLTLMTTVLCIVCYCCHRSIKKRTEAAYRQQHQWLENDPNMEIYSVEQVRNIHVYIYIYIMYVCECRKSYFIIFIGKKLFLMHYIIRFSLLMDILYLRRYISKKNSNALLI